ncbi:hypothetical protein HAX54_000534, partial [Datura stramonium]|nr:hypothetical protein [Datura stramonium]
GYPRTAGDRKKIGVETFQSANFWRTADRDPQNANVTRGQGSGLKPIFTRISISLPFCQNRMVNSR